MNHPTLCLTPLLDGGSQITPSKADFDHYIFPALQVHQCTVFTWQGFSSRGTKGVPSVKSCWKLPPCPTEPMSAGSQTDPSLAKAKPISNDGSKSEITYLRSRKIPMCNSILQQERGVRQCEQNYSADSKFSEEGGGGGAPGAGAEVPVQPMQKTMVKQAVRCSPWRSTVEQISTCSPWRTTHRRRWTPIGGSDLVESPCWSRVLAGPVDPWRQEPMPEQVF